MVINQSWAQFLSQSHLTLHSYTLSEDIYAAHFLKLFDIHKYLFVQTMYIQKNEKIQGFLLETPLFSCQVSI